MRFPGPNPLARNGSPAWQHHLEIGALASSAARSLPVHPTQLYESAVGLLLLGLTLLVWSHRKRRGEVFVAFTMGYGVLRFLLELLRGDTQRGDGSGGGGLEHHRPAVLPQPQRLRIAPIDRIQIREPRRAERERHHSDEL